MCGPSPSFPHPGKKGYPDPTHLLDLPSQNLCQHLASTRPSYLGSLPIEWEHSKWGAGQTYDASSEAHGPQSGFSPGGGELMSQIQPTRTAVSISLTT